MTHKRLPIGIQNIREIREKNCYYVDKTPFAVNLVRHGKYFFSIPPPAIRQETVSGHPEGAVRRQSGAVYGALRG